MARGSHDFQMIYLALNYQGIGQDLIVDALYDNIRKNKLSLSFCHKLKARAMLLVVFVGHVVLAQIF